MPHFRPLPILSVFTLASVILLVGLGTWQVQRMAWKTDLIAAYEQRGTAASFAQALCGGFDAPFGPTVRAPAPLLGPQLRYYSLRDEAGWIRLGLMRKPQCSPDEAPSFIFIESAFETLRSGNSIRPEAWRIDPLPEPRGFGSNNNPDADEWYVFDHDTMAQALGVEPSQVLSVWARSDLGMPNTLVATPPAKHLGYALTWFGLAIALLGVYVALHITRGRLHWR
jgi:surfeit locus 1 family protein